MAKELNFGIKFNNDTSNLDKVKSELQSIQRMTQAKYLSLNKGLNAAEAAHQLKEVKKSALDIQEALRNAFNANLGTTNITKFSKELQQLDLTKIQKQFNTLGPLGKQTFRDMTTEIITSNLQLKKTHNLLEDMKTSMANTVKWGITSSIMNSFTGSVQKALSYVKGLDSSLNDIRIVTNKSAEEMDNFAVKANKAAQSLGASTRDYTDAALIYYQQGLSDKESQARADVTVKTANVTQQSAAEVSEQLTAIWNGYKVSAEESELYIDKVAAVAAATAADLEELSTGMSKVASAANAMGVDFDKLNAMLATVVSVTRESPETIGTSFKNIFARMSQLQTTGSDDEGVELTKVTKQMQDLGIEILDEKGNLRDVGDTIDEVAGKWENWSKAQQVAAARVMAGTQQYSRFIALMDNQDMWRKAEETSKNSLGALQQQQDIYMERSEAHLQQLSTAFEDVYDSLFESKAFNSMIDSVTFVVNRLGDLIDGIGGAGSAFLMLGGIATKIFSKQIGQSIGTAITNMKNMKSNTEQIKGSMEVLKQLQTQVKDGDSILNNLINIKSEVQTLHNTGIISDEEFNQINDYMLSIKKAEEAIEDFTEEKREAAEDFEKIMGGQTVDFKEIDDKAQENKIDNKNPKQGAEIEKTNKALKEKSKIYQELKIKLKENTVEYQKYQKEISKEQANVKNEQQAADIRTKSLEKVKQKYKENKNEMNSYFQDLSTQVANSKYFDETDQAEIKESLRIVQGYFSGTADVAEEEFNEAINNIATAVGRLEERVQGIQGTVTDAGNNKTQNLQTNKNINTQGLKDALNEKNLQQKTQAIASLAGTIMQCYSAVMGLFNAFEIVNNQDLSFGERVSQISGIVINSVIAIIGVVTSLTVAAAVLEIELWPLTLIVAAIAVGIAGLVAAGVAMSEALNKDANAAKAAREQADLLAESYQKLKEKAEELKETISEYDAGKKALEDLTEGTEDFRKKVEETNKQAEELIKTLGLVLGKDYTIDKNGLINIDPDKLKEQQEKADKDASAANITAREAEIGALKAQQTADATKTSRDFGYDWGKQLGETLITLIPGVGPLIKAYRDITGISEENSRKYSTEQTQEMGNAFASLMDKLGEEAYNSVFSNDESLKKALLELDNLSPAVRDNIDVLIENKEKLNEFGKSISETNQKIKQQSDEIIKQDIKDRYSKKHTEIATGKDGKVDQGRVDLIQAAATKLADENSQKMANELKNINVSNVDSNNKLNDKFKDKGYAKIENDESLARIYAKEVLGREDADQLQYDGGWGKGTLKTADGKETLIEDMDDNQMRQAIARSRLSKEIEDKYTGENGLNLDKFNAAVEKMYNSQKEGEPDIASALLQQMQKEKGTVDLKSIYGELSPEEILKYQDMSAEELLKSMGLNEEDIKALGFQSGDDFASKFKEATKQYDATDFITNSKQKAKDAQDALGVLSLGDESELDEDQLSKLKALENEYEELGRIKNRTSHEYLEMLRQIKEQEEQNAMDGLKYSKQQNEEKVNKLKEDLDNLLKDKEQDENGNWIDIDEEAVKGKLDEIEKALDELAKNKYEIQLQIEADLASDVTDAFDLANEFGQLTDLVNDDLEYTFEEAQKIIDMGYGEMLTGAQETANQTIKLNKDMVNNFIDGKQAELDADKESKIGQLENEKALVIAQRDALTRKLEALKQALNASNEADAAAALAKVQNAENEYEAATEALNAELEDEAEGATETQNINAELYNALGGMYEEDANNENQAEADATNNQQANINARIENVRALHQAYSSLATQIRESENGVNTDFSAGSTTSGVNTGTTAPSNIQGNNQKANRIDVKNLNLAGMFDENGATQQYKDTINKIIGQTEGQIRAANAQIGSLDAGIAALKSAGKTLDKKQADAGKGKSGSNKEAKQEDYLDDEKDRYHDIDIILKQISNDLSKLDKQKSKLFGGNLIKNLNKQLGLIDKQIDATRKKIDIAEGEAGELRGKLSNQGVQFNADGTIANYADAYDAQLAYVNGIIAKYNAMDAESQEAFKDTVDAAKEQFKEFTSQIDNYDKLITDTIPGMKEEIMEAIYQEIEIELEKFNMEIEIRLDMAQAKKDWEDFEKSVILKISDKNILGNAEYAVQKQLSTYYKEDGTGIIQKDTEHVNNVMNEIKKAEAGQESKYSKFDPETGEFLYDQTAAMEDLDNYRTQLMSDMKEYQELVQQVRQYELDMMDKVQEGMDKQLETYEQINSLINHDMKLIQLVYGDKAYSQMSNYYKKQNENYKAQLKVQKENKDFWETEMNIAEKRIKADYDHMKALEANKDASEEGAQAYADAREAWEHSSEVFENAKDKWSTAVEEWRTTIEEALQGVIDAYINSINEIFQKLENEVTGGKGLDYINEEWELINKEADMYLDTVNGIYNVQKLQGKYLKALDNTDSLTAQKKLNALMQEEIDYLESKDKLTQYDIDRANLKYEIALKQIALEEAQQNKSNMRLKRDSQGNYSYQFVSDEDEIGNLKDELSDLYNQLYNLTNDDLRNLQESWLNTFQEMEDKIKDVAANTSLTYEQKQAQIALIKEHYTSIMTGLEEQYQERVQQLQLDSYLELVDFYKKDNEIYQTTLGNKFEGLETMIEQSIDSIRLGADEEISEWERMVGINMTTIEGLGTYLNETVMPAINSYWDSGVKEMIDKVIGEGGFETVTKGAMDSIAEKTKEVQKEIEEIGNVAGISYEQIAEGKDKDIEKTEQQIDWYETLVQEYRDEYDALKDVESALSEIVLRYKEAEAAAKAAAAAAYAYSQALKDQAAAEAAKDQKNNNTNNNNNNNTNNNNNNSGGGGNGGGDGRLSVGDVATFTGKYYYDSYGTSPAGSRYSGVANGIVIDKLNNNPYGAHIHSADGKFGDLGWVKKSQLSGYDTGGYTGEWGSEGRLALLHEKEIVLNAMDTENILKAVSMVRDFAGLLNQMSALSSLSTFGFGDGTAETIEQSVHIEASFPGVRESREIEMALDNLVNRASQKVHENKR